MSRMLIITLCLIAINLAMRTILPAMAGDNTTTDGRAAASAIAGGMRGDIQTLTGTLPTPETLPGYVGTNVPQAGYTNDNLVNAGNITLDNGSQKARDAVTTSPTPVALDPDKYSSALNIQISPDNITSLNALLGSTYEDCEENVTGGQPAEKRYCDGWRETESARCAIDRIVEVDADVRYQCDREAGRIHQTCERVLSSQCSRQSACDTINLAFTTHTTRGTWPLTHEGGGFFAAGDGRVITHSRSCLDTIRTVTFDIPNVDHITYFRIMGGAYDDAASISINDHMLYVSGSARMRTGGHLTARRHTRRYWVPQRCGECPEGHWETDTRTRPVNDAGYLNCNRRTVHSVPQLDLLPYLQTGRNVIQMNIVHGPGNQGWFRFAVAMTCCAEISRVWSEQCS